MLGKLNAKDKSPVVYGSRNEEALPNTRESETEKQAAFRALVEGEFKEVYEAELESILARHAEYLSEKFAEQEQNRSQWQDQLADLRKEYPTFDLEAESENEAFVSLLNVGIPLKYAYEVAHLDEIKQNFTKEMRNSRPVENGITSQGGVVIKNDVNKLTKADRAEIAKRVERGEIIRF
ncbi:MAG: hypothetical protein RR053_07730 [Evtepia sp.]